MRSDELAADVRAWAHALMVLDDPRWARFDVCARELARLVARVVAPAPAPCGHCGAAVAPRETIAAIVYGDPGRLREQLATRDGRAQVWSRLWLVAALLDGFCSEWCATEAGTTARRRPSLGVLAARRRRRRRRDTDPDRAAERALGDVADEDTGVPFEGLVIGLRLR